MTPTTNAPQHNSHDEIDLFELAEDLWKQKWLILGVTTLFTSLALAYALLATPVYQAAARVMPPSAGDVLPFNLSRVQAGMTGLDVGSAYALFKVNLTSLATRRWFLEEHYRPYSLEQGATASREELTQQLTEVLTVRRPDERNNPEMYEITVNIDQAELAAEWAAAYVKHAAARGRSNLEIRTMLEIANRRTELQQRIEVLRSSTQDERKDRIARLKEALQIAEAVGFDAPQVTRGQTAAGNELAQVIDGNLLYMRGSRAIRSELELLEGRENDDPFISELRGLEQQINLLDVIGPVPEAVQLFTLDSPADVPDRPIKPKKAMIVVLGGILGGMLGGMIALVRIAVVRRSAKQVSDPLQ